MLQRSIIHLPESLRTMKVLGIVIQSEGSVHILFVGYYYKRLSVVHILDFVVSFSCFWSLFIINIVCICIHN